MKVLYINKLLNSPSGASIHGRKIAEKLKSHGISLSTIPSFRNDNKYNKKITNTIMLNFFPVLRELVFFIKRTSMSFLGFGFIYIKIKKFRPDCILVRQELYDLTPILLKNLCKTPIILELNEVFYYERKLYYESQNKKALIPFIFLNIEFIIWKSSDAIYVVSNRLKKYIELQLGSKSPPIKVIPNGVDMKYLSSNSNKFVQNESKIVKICFSGSLQFWHGVDLLLDVYKDVVNLRPNTKLIFIGDGESRVYMKKYVLNYSNLQNRVIFTGKLYHSNTMRKLSEMDILVAPYKNSKFFYFSPIKIFEYMASGKAIIASSQGQISEILKNKVDAILINAEDKEEFLNALLFLIDNKEERIKLGNKALKKAEEYTWEKSASNLLGFINSTIHHFGYSKLHKKECRK